MSLASQVTQLYSGIVIQHLFNKSDDELGKALTPRFMGGDTGACALLLRCFVNKSLMANTSSGSQSPINQHSKLKDASPIEDNAKPEKPRDITTNDCHGS